jgi:UDP-N-acetylmuramate--alanine ligase
VIGVALVLDLNLDITKKQLATFSGVKRRFTEKQWGSNIVIDDYAHHPSEIRATLEAVRSKYPQKKVVGIFQPHTFSRLEKLIDDFALSLKEADDVYLCEIFGSAREERGNISIDELRTKIPNNDSVLVFMGAGDIQKYEDALFQT